MQILSPFGKVLLSLWKGKCSNKRLDFAQDCVTLVHYTDDSLLQPQGTAVPGLGVFTFSKKTIDVGNKKFIIIQRPVFLLSEKLAQTHSLHATKIHTPGNLFLHAVFQFSSYFHISRSNSNRPPEFFQYL